MGVRVCLVTVEGASWGGAERPRTFPGLEDLPETVLDEEGGSLAVRAIAARANVLETAPRLEHTRAYFPEFVKLLLAELGPPPSTHSLVGDARTVWLAAGAGEQLQVLLGARLIASDCLRLPLIASGCS